MENLSLEEMLHATASNLISGMVHDPPLFNKKSEGKKLQDPESLQTLAMNGTSDCSHTSRIHNFVHEWQNITIDPVILAMATLMLVLTTLDICSYMIGDS